MCAPSLLLRGGDRTGGVRVPALLPGAAPVHRHLSPEGPHARLQPRHQRGRRALLTLVPALTHSSSCSRSSGGLEWQQWWWRWGAVNDSIKPHSLTHFLTHTNLRMQQSVTQDVTGMNIDLYYDDDDCLKNFALSISSVKRKKITELHGTTEIKWCAHTVPNADELFRTSLNWEAIEQIEKIELRSNWEDLQEMTGGFQRREENLMDFCQRHYLSVSQFSEWPLWMSSEYAMVWVRGHGITFQLVSEDSA